VASGTRAHSWAELTGSCRLISECTQTTETIFKQTFYLLSYINPWVTIVIWVYSRQSKSILGRLNKHRKNGIRTDTLCSIFIPMCMDSTTHISEYHKNLPHLTLEVIKFTILASTDPSFLHLLSNCLVCTVSAQ